MKQDEIKSILKLILEAENRKKELSQEIGVYSEQIRIYQKKDNKPMLAVTSIYAKYLIKHYDILKNCIDELKKYLGDHDGKSRKTKSTKTISNSGGSTE